MTHIRALGEPRVRVKNMDHVRNRNKIAHHSLCVLLKAYCTVTDSCNALKMIKDMQGNRGHQVLCSAEATSTLHQVLYRLKNIEAWHDVRVVFSSPFKLHSMCRKANKKSMCKMAQSKIHAVRDMSRSLSIVSKPLCTQSPCHVTDSM